MSLNNDHQERLASDELGELFYTHTSHQNHRTAREQLETIDAIYEIELVCGREPLGGDREENGDFRYNEH